VLTKDLGDRHYVAATLDSSFFTRAAGQTAISALTPVPPVSSLFFSSCASTEALNPPSASGKYFTQVTLWDTFAQSLAASTLANALWIVFSRFALLNFSFVIIQKRWAAETPMSHLAGKARTEESWPVLAMHGDCAY
jgi:hypothetical protein